MACRAASVAAGVCASPYAGSAKSAWGVGFRYGYAARDGRSGIGYAYDDFFLVRLVR